jgi:hypothetical protein
MSSLTFEIFRLQQPDERVAEQVLIPAAVKALCISCS